MAWLSGYDQRIKLTIDNTKIDAALSDFPVTVFFTPAQGEEIFTEFDADADYMKCAFTASDGTTQLYAEKEEFDVYKSQYPTVQSDTYVKSTTKVSTDFWAYYATDPAKSLTGASENNSWLSNLGETTNQRFHIDLGSAKTIKKIYYENFHASGAHIDRGVQNFTFWGSNTGAGTFDDLVYANDEGWTQLTISQSTFDQHAASDAADPKYITVTNTTAYRYYAFKFADNYGDDQYMGVRRIELQRGEVIYHVKVTSIASGADTDIYYYYDNDHADNTTYIGAIDTTAGATVWDDNFKAVYHMVDATTSTIKDSTSNNNDGTKKGANEPIEAIGKVGQGQDFDGANDYITIPASTDLNPETGDFTVEVVFDGAAQTFNRLASNKESVNDEGWSIQGETGTDAAPRFMVEDHDANTINGTGSGSTLYDTNWHYLVGIRNTGGDTIEMYADVNGDTASLEDTTDITINSTNNLYIGSASNGTTNPFDGIIDEFRISKSIRNAA